MIGRRFLCEANTAERRAIIHASLLADARVEVTLNRGAGPDQSLLFLGAVPVGSVEFVQQALRILGVAEPPSLSYPASLRGFMRRSCHKTTAGKVSHRAFVKPVKPKLFTGFVYEPESPMDRLSEHDWQQLLAFRGLKATEQVWIADVVKWASEVRYYVLNGQVIGSARYDNGPNDAWLPDENVVEQMVAHTRAAHRFPVAFALDVGVLSTGETALVECNDAWALGFYPWGTLTTGDYCRMLTARWQELTAHSMLGGATY